MKPSQNELHVSVIGSADFTRRMSTSLRQRPRVGESTEISLSSGNFAEAKGLILEHRPNVLVFDIGFRTSRMEVIWLRSLLQQLRERSGRDLYIIMAITRPERFALAGNLFFQDERSLLPSGLIDNLIITPPPGASLAPSIEQQLSNCLDYVAERQETQENGKVGLPALWDDHWVPVMCDPISRDVWMRWLPRYARYTNENPLIVGPTGSGKTRLAAAIHQISERKGPFISITPRDFSSTELVQAELFGAVAGAYTGAVDKWGLVRQAEKGTLFIDELQSIDRDLQGKLITFIENKTYRRVGEAESHQADVRFVFATNRPLQDLVDDGSLRDDFAYRLERLQITLPPLHERRLDIAAGASFALAKVLRERAQARSGNTGLGRDGILPLLGFTPEAYRLLYGASWPGNLRQLENTMAKLVEFADIKNETLIAEGSMKDAMEGVLGRKIITAGDVFSQAAKNLATYAHGVQFRSLGECAARFTEETRALALEYSGGDPEKASALVGESVQVMKLFAAART